MTAKKLPAGEREILNAVENGEFISVLDDRRRKELEDTAASTFRKDKRINIRLSNRDLLAVQSRASKEGIPYQTLVSSIIHKYVSGSLVDASD